MQHEVLDAEDVVVAVVAVDLVVVVEVVVDEFVILDVVVDVVKVVVVARVVVVVVEHGAVRQVVLMEFVLGEPRKVTVPSSAAAVMAPASPTTAIVRHAIGKFMILLSWICRCPPPGGRHRLPWLNQTQKSCLLAPSSPLVPPPPPIPERRPCLSALH